MYLATNFAMANMMVTLMGGERPSFSAKRKLFENDDVGTLLWNTYLVRFLCLLKANDHMKSIIDCIYYALQWSFG